MGKKTKSNDKSNNSRVLNTSHRMNNGVNFFGPYEAKDSIGRVASLNIECLKESQLPHDIYLLSRPKPSQSINYATIDEELISKLRYRVNLFHFNARRVPLYFSRLGEDSLKGFYNIGFWVHEMQAIPGQWARQMEFFNEIWTPSSICQSAVSLSANIPVIKIPYPIEDGVLSKRITSISNGGKYEQFNFLAVFDVYSDAERKNPLFTVKAFLDAFAKKDNIRLILKTRNLEYDTLLSKKLKEITAEHKNIVVMDGYLNDDELAQLYDSADVYVSLHRAEGFGLTISDAMSKGIPVIVTGYSGNMDFCNASETRLVSYDLVEVGHNRPRYKSSDVWAEPDIHDAVEAFRDLFLNHESWIKKAAKAKRALQRDFSVKSVAEQMRQRVNLINSKFEHCDDMSGRRIDCEVGIRNTYGF